MQATSFRLLAFIAMTAGVFGWVLATVSDTMFGRYLPMPWTASVAVWLLALAVGMWAWIVRPRLLRRPGHAPLPSYVAARTAALALAGSRVGAGLAGAYVGMAIALIGSYAIPAARDGFWVAVLTSVGSVLMMVLSYWLETMCRLPGDDDNIESVRGTDSTLGGITGSAPRSTP